MGLLSAQVADLREERRILLDRLATLGLGGPLFPIAKEENIESEPETEEILNPDQELIDELLRFKHRPSKLSDELTRQAQLEHKKRYERPKVAWIPQVERIQAELDKAEEQGKNQAY